MKKGLLTIALLLLAIGLVCTPRAEALDCGGTAFIIPSTDTLPVPGSVNDEYTIAYRIQNTSIATSGTPIGATIKAGKRIYEWDQCNGTTCQDTFFPDVVQYVGCQPAAALVGKISCTANTTAIGPPVPGEVNPEVIIDVLQDIAFTPNEIKDLVIVTKKAIGCVDTAEPLIAFRIETDVNAFNCVSGTLTGTGGAQKSGSQLAPCEYDLSVVKTCDPAEGCVGSDIDISATITNGKFAQIDITSVTDSNGTPLTCTRANGTVVSPTFRMDPNEVVTCTGSTTPTTDGTYCDTITVKSATTFGEALPDKVSDEVCCKKILVKPVIDVVKACTAPQVSGGKITYEVKVNNLTPQTCNGQPWDVTLNCTATDTNPDVTYDQPLTFTLAPGANKTFTGSYSCAKLQCPTTLDVPNTFKVVCTDPYQQQATDQDSATCVCPCRTTTTTTTIPEACWLTGGGVKFEPLVGARLATAKSKGGGGPVISMGGNVNPGCSPLAGDGGNWNIIDHEAKLHFQGRHIEVVECGNIPESIRPPGSDSPKTPFNYIEFEGTGILKGISGNKYDAGPVTFYGRAEDRNEPGSKETLGPALIDRFWIRVWDASGNTVYSFPPIPPGNDVTDPDTICGDDSFTCTDTFAITGGNLQIHITSCDTLAPPLQ